MNIVYSSSDSFSDVCGTSMYTLLERHRDIEELNIYLISNHITEVNCEKFMDLCASYGRSLTIIPIENIESRVGKTIDIGRWNISTFARLFYCSLLPETVEKVIHIDCDTYIADSLLPMWEYDLGDCLVAGAIELIGDNFKRELGLSLEDNYINAGNIVINLAAARREGIEDVFVQYMAGHDQLSFVDQAVINACVPNDKKMVIPLRYNAYSLPFYLSYKNLRRVKHATNYCDREEVEAAVKDPAIVHFTSCFMDGTRPWMEHNRHPYVALYREARKASPWGDMPLWRDKRGFLKRCVYALMRMTPKWMLCGMISFLHNTIIPARHRKKSKKKCKS